MVNTPDIAGTKVVYLATGNLFEAQKGVYLRLKRS